MDLESLKALLDEALAKSKAAPDDKDLKAKADEAQVAYDAALADEDDEDDVIDESKLDAKTQKQLKKLRDENAKARLKNKDLKSKFETSEAQKKAILKAAGIETEEDDPEETIKSLTAETQTHAFRAAILEKALEHGIPASNVKYFQYLVSEAAVELEEGEELSEEQLTAIVKEAKARGGKKATTTFGAGGKGDETPEPGTSGELTLDQFTRMSISEKSALYEKHPERYKELAAEAKAKKRLV